MRKLLGPEAIICVLIGALYLLIWPIGEYGVNDEWAYVKSLQHLHFEGRLQVLECVTTSLVGLLFWGLAFTKLLGFSFTAAGLLVVVLHALECVFLFRTLSLCGVDQRPALYGVLALMLNPLHTANAFSFMTDVPALAFEVISLFCYLKAISAGSVAWHAGRIRGPTAPAHREGAASLRQFLWLAGGSLAAGEAFLIRQHGVLVPAAFFIYLGAFERHRLTLPSCAAAFAPVALVVAGFAYYQSAYGQAKGDSIAVSWILDFLRHPPLAEVPYVVFAFAIYAGWFITPLAGAMRGTLFLVGSHMRLLVFFALAFAGLNGLLFYGLGTGRVFPYIWNTVTPFGLFSPDGLVIGKRDMLWGEPVGWVLSVASLVAVLALAFRMVCGRTVSGREDRRRAESIPNPRSAPQGLSADPQPAETPPVAASPNCDEFAYNRGQSFRVRSLGLAGKRLFGILLGLQVIFLFITAPVLFDRHLLLFAPTVIALFCLFSGASQDFSVLRYLVCLVPIGAYAVATTHDMHALSRTVFVAGQTLVGRGVDPRTITAGFSFDGWHTYELATTHPTTAASGLHWTRRINWAFFRADQQEVEWEARWDRAWWPALMSVSTERTYLVATSPGPDAPAAAGLVTEQLYHYQNWWPWKVNSVVVFRKARR